MKVARIAVLTVALGAGGVAAMLAGNSRAPAPTPEAPVAQVETTDVLVAKGDLAIGHSLKAQDVEWRAWPTKYLSDQFIRKAPGKEDIGDVANSVTRASFVAGEPIRETKLIKANGSGFMAASIPAGMRAVATEISPEAGAGGFILPNDRVDVILTGAEKTGGTEIYKTKTILKDIRVLAIDQTVEEKAGQKTAMGKIATLELSPADAEKLSLARRLGNISLILRSLAEKRGDDQGTDSLGRQETITIVRFGNASPQTPAN